MVAPLLSAGANSLRPLKSKLPPARLRRFLATTEAIRTLGASQTAAERKRLERERARLQSNVPSSSWFDAADNHSQPFPPGAGDKPTPHGVRMIVSMVSGRYTPPQALKVEDFLDRMSAPKAEFYNYPPSTSALAIKRIRDKWMGKDLLTFADAATLCGITEAMLRRAFELDYFSYSQCIPTCAGLRVPQAYAENHIGPQLRCWKRDNDPMLGDLSN